MAGALSLVSQDISSSHPEQLMDVIVAKELIKSNIFILQSAMLKITKESGIGEYNLRQGLKSVSTLLNCPTCSAALTDRDSELRLTIDSIVDDIRQALSNVSVSTLRNLKNNSPIDRWNHAIYSYLQTNAQTENFDDYALSTDGIKKPSVIRAFSLMKKFYDVLCVMQLSINEIEQNVAVVKRYDESVDTISLLRECEKAASQRLSV